MHALLKCYKPVLGGVVVTVQLEYFVLYLECMDVIHTCVVAIIVHVYILCR